MPASSSHASDSLHADAMWVDIDVYVVLPHSDLQIVWHCGSCFAYVSDVWLCSLPAAGYLCNALPQDCDLHSSCNATCCAYCVICLPVSSKHGVICMPAESSDTAP